MCSYYKHLPTPVMDITCLCNCSCIPVDTMGYAFTFPVVSLLGNVPVGAYVHYPTISTTMLSRVKSRTAGVTNSAAISSSTVLSSGKLLYALNSSRAAPVTNLVSPQILPSLHVLLCLLPPPSSLHHGQFIMDQEPCRLHLGTYRPISGRCSSTPSSSPA